MRLPESVRAHPVMTVVLVLSAVGGGVLAATYAPAEWSLARRVLAGLLGGLGAGLTVVTTRMLGAFGEKPE